VKGCKFFEVKGEDPVGDRHVRKKNPAGNEGAYRELLFGNRSGVQGSPFRVTFLSLTYPSL